MAGRGPQSFKKRQKEQQRKEKQQAKMEKRLQRRREASEEVSDSPDGVVAGDAAPVTSETVSQ